MSTVSVQCTLLTPYTLGLGAGNGAGATIAARKMTNVAGTIDYSLYTDLLHTDVWGTGGGGANGSTVPGIGTGLALPHIVYGRVPPQTTPGPGVYTDVVAVTVTY
nr:spore coat protein U domain-containing protein [Mesorhizobium sp. NBSH29]